MSTPQPIAATPAGAPDRRASERSSRPTSGEAGATEPEGLWAHGMRLLRSRLSAAVNGVLDPVIASLQRMRTAAGGEPEAGGDADRSRPGNDRAGGKRDDAAAPGEADAGASKPGRRLPSFLAYASVLLAGGMGGGALAYNMLSVLLDHQFAESRQLEGKMAGHAKAIEDIQGKLDDEQAKSAAEGKKLEASAAEYKAALAERQKKFDASLAEYKTALAEKQKKFDDSLAEYKELQVLLASIDRVRGPRKASNVSSASLGRATRPVNAGDCAMEPGKMAALKDCIDNFNR